MLISFQYIHIFYCAVPITDKNCGTEGISDITQNYTAD